MHIHIQAGCGSGQPGLLVGDPAHSRGLKLDDHCGPFQPRPMYDSMILKGFAWAQIPSPCIVHLQLFILALLNFDELCVLVLRCQRARVSSITSLVSSLLLGICLSLRDGGKEAVRDA